MSDLDDLYEYLSDEEVVKYEPYKPMSKEEVQSNLDLLNVTRIIQIHGGCWKHLVLREKLI